MISANLSSFDKSINFLLKRPQKTNRYFGLFMKRPKSAWKSQIEQFLIKAKPNVCWERFWEKRLIFKPRSAQFGLKIQEISTCQETEWLANVGELWRTCHVFFLMIISRYSGQVTKVHDWWPGNCQVKISNILDNEATSILMNFELEISLKCAWNIAEKTKKLRNVSKVIFWPKFKIEFYFSTDFYVEHHFGPFLYQFWTNFGLFWAFFDLFWTFFGPFWGLF